MILAAACATAPAPGDVGYPYNVVGAYRGRFMFDGQPFDATMNLRTGARGRVTGAFRVAAPVELDGPVEGVVIDDLFRLTVSYRDPFGCASTLEGLLTVQAGGNQLEGPVTVEGCGESVAGRMAFRREDGGSEARRGNRSR